MLDKRQAFTFVWGLNDDTLHACTPATLFVSRDPSQNSGPAAVPPYSLIAYPEQGTPVIDPLGNGPENIPWTPRFAAGTKLILSIVDSAGNSGGVAQQSYTLGSSASTSCIPPPSSNDLSIDVTGTSVNTCDILPIRISGGQKPYVVSIAGTDQSSTFNTTMTGDNDYLQWVSRITPGNVLVVAVSDSSGQYAKTSSFITTAGQTSTTCEGKQDVQSVFSGSPTSGGSGGTGTNPNPSNTSTPGSGGGGGGGSKGVPAGAIIGGIIGALVIVGVIAYFYFRKRNQKAFEGGSRPAAPGFGLVNYKAGNPGAHDSFMPLQGSPNASRVPLYSDQSPLTASAALAPSTGPNRMSGVDYYAHPPSDVSGTTSGWGTSAGHSHTLSSGTGIGLGVAAMGPPSAASGAQTKRQMVLEEQRRQQQMRAGQVHPAPPSVYPPPSSYGGDPFRDNMYPSQQQYGMQGPPAPNTQYGIPPSTVSHPYGVSPVAYTNPTGSGSGGSQDMTPAARAKAAEAQQEAAQSRRGYDDDEDPIPYMQRQRTVLGVTNPDRNSQASGMSDPYAGMAPTAAVYQHEDAGEVVELPPAYREFSKTPAPPSSDRNNPQ